MNAQDQGFDRHAEANLQLIRLKAGDREAMAYLQKRLENKMLMTAYERLDRREEAENAVQDALVRVWANREKLPDTWQEAQLYVLRIAANCALDMLRKAEAKLRTISLEEPLLTARPSSDRPIASPYEEMLAEIVDELANEFPNRLRERQRRLLVAMSQRLSRPYEMIDQVYRDVGDELDLAWASVRNEWSRIGCSLKEHWGKPMPDEAVRELLRRVGQAL